MNETMVLSLVKPFVKDNKLTYDDFERIFNELELSLKEQYAITDILHAKGIELVDEHTSENILVLDIDDQLDVSDDFDDDSFLERYDDSVFKDRSTFKDQNNNLVVNRVVHQSNEILCSLIQQGSLQAAQDLCVKNNNLVSKYVLAYEKRYNNRLDFEDMAQAGFIGLLKAAERFNIKQGNAFSTYAVFWIKQSIAREIMDNGFAIRIPVHMMERISKVAAASSRLNTEGVQLLDQIHIIAQELSYTEDIVTECLILKQNYLSYVSLDSPVGEDNETMLGDFIPIEEDETVESIIMGEALRQELSKILTTLSAREQEVIKLRMGWEDNNPKTLEEIGDLYGVTRERIRQIETKALRKLRHPARIKFLKDFWEV